MPIPFPEATAPRSDRTEVLLGYLDFFRATVAEKVRSLPEAARRRSAVPSGWTPVELVAHLTAMERRWLVWGFEGVAVDDPWRDERDGRWFVHPGVTTEAVLAALADQGAETARIARLHALDEVGQPSERWSGADPPPSSGCCSTCCRSTPGTRGTSTSSSNSPAARPGSELLAPRSAWSQNGAMTNVQIKDVPEDTHRVLRRRAADAHQSLQEYLRSHLIAEAARPTMAEVLAESARAARGQVTFDDVLDVIRSDRDRH